MDPGLHAMHQVRPGHQGDVTAGGLDRPDGSTTREDTPTRPSEEESTLHGGEVIAVEEARVQVRLDTGAIGFVPRSDGGDVRDLAIGSHATFRIVSADPSGDTTLAAVQIPVTPVAGVSFDRDVDRLQDALANHHPAAPAPPVERVSLGEEQITNWLTAVDASIGRIRKNRAKRLNEEFYNS